MKFYRVFIISLILFSASFINSSNAAEDSKPWVAVTVFDGRTTGALPEYFAQISQKSLDELTSKTKEFQMFKLENIFWTDDAGNAIKFSDAKKHGRTYGYTNTAYFRADHIYRIVFLDENYIKKIFKNSK
jgi:hypothetical protein